MFDRIEFLRSLNECKRAGDTVFVPLNGQAPRDLREHLIATLKMWGRTNGVETGITEETPEGILCMIAHIKSGSPMRSRTMRPWFHLEIDDAKFVSADEYAVGSLRAYVSQFCSKLDQRISVEVAKGGCTITRTK